METQTQKILKRGNKVLEDFKYKTSLKYLADRKKQIEYKMQQLQEKIDRDNNSDDILNLIRRWRIWSGKLQKINEKYYNWKPLENAKKKS